MKVKRFHCTASDETINEFLGGVETVWFDWLKESDGPDFFLCVMYEEIDVEELLDDE